jgi:hypothetical protein
LHGLATAAHEALAIVTSYGGDERGQGTEDGPSEEICCKVAVIFRALYAVWSVVFCSNDCFSALCSAQTTIVPREMVVYFCGRRCVPGHFNFNENKHAYLHQ